MPQRRKDATIKALRKKNAQPICLFEIGPSDDKEQPVLFLKICTFLRVKLYCLSVITGNSFNRTKKIENRIGSFENQVAYEILVYSRSASPQSTKFLVSSVPRLSALPMPTSTFCAIDSFCQKLHFLVQDSSLSDRYLCRNPNRSKKRLSFSSRGNFQLL